METEPRPGYFLDLLRAELARALAEQQVNLIDRFASKNELGEVRDQIFVLERQTNGRFNEINGKLDQLLNDKMHRDGAEDVRQRWSRRWEVWCGVAIGLFTALIGSASTLAAVYLGG